MSAKEVATGSSGNSMSVRGKKTGNGTYEFTDYLREPDRRSKWQIFKDGLYNPEDGTIFGHTKKRWGIVGLFYLIFYAVLALMCAICMAGLMSTIDENRPKYTLDSSLIGSNPGLGFRPLPPTEERSLIWYNAANATNVMEWVKRLDSFLEYYLDPSKLKNGGTNQMVCSYQLPAQKNRACVVDWNDWGECVPSKSYGYNNSTPCVFIKLNRIFDWIPEYYNSSKNLPDEMPDDLKQHIAYIEAKRPHALNTVWVSCVGEDPLSKETIHGLKYFPEIRGFPGYYFPYTNQPEYLSPVVAVKFDRPEHNVVIKIECKAWAKNIVYSSYRGEKKGAVHFEVQVDKDATK